MYILWFETSPYSGVDCVWTIKNENPKREKWEPQEEKMARTTNHFMHKYWTKQSTINLALGSIRHDINFISQPVSWDCFYARIIHIKDNKTTGIRHDYIKQLMVYLFIYVNCLICWQHSVVSVPSYTGTETEKSNIMNNLPSILCTVDKGRIKVICVFLYIPKLELISN